MIIFNILIQIVFFFLVAAVIAVPLGLGLYFFSKRKRKRKLIFGLASPFVFVLSFYFISLIGALTCASVFRTGCATDGFWRAELPRGYAIESIEDDFIGSDLTGSIVINHNHIVDSVAKINVSGDTIFGEQYTAHGPEQYFTLNTKTGELNQHATLTKAQTQNLTNVEPFYYKSWKWVNPLGITAFVISSSLVLLLWLLIVTLNPSKLIAKAINALTRQPAP